MMRQFVGHVIVSTRVVARPWPRTGRSCARAVRAASSSGSGMVRYVLQAGAARARPTTPTVVARVGARTLQRYLTGPLG